jgi:hypothetical protein
MDALYSRFSATFFLILSSRFHLISQNGRLTSCSPPPQKIVYALLVFTFLHVRPTQNSRFYNLGMLCDITAVNSKGVAVFNYASHSESIQGMEA